MHNKILNSVPERDKGLQKWFLCSLVASFVYLLTAFCPLKAEEDEVEGALSSLFKGSTALTLMGTGVTALSHYVKETPQLSRGIQLIKNAPLPDGFTIPAGCTLVDGFKLDAKTTTLQLAKLPLYTPSLYNNTPLKYAALASLSIGGLLIAYKLSKACWKQVSHIPHKVSQKIINFVSNNRRQSVYTALILGGLTTAYWDSIKALFALTENPTTVTAINEFIKNKPIGPVLALIASAELLTKYASGNK